eukprot:SAG11_NODE_2570_length_3211_cov_4.381427_3_plen_32_part_00
MSCAAAALTVRATAIARARLSGADSEPRKQV